MLWWCKMNYLSLEARNEDKIYEKSKQEKVPCISSQILFVSFSKVLILFLFALISSSATCSEQDNYGGFCLLI